MKKFRSIFLYCVLITFLSAQVSQPVVASDNHDSPKMKSKKITKNYPRVLITPEEKIPKEKMKTSTKILIGVLAAALIGGVLALAGSSGGGGEDAEPTTGGIAVGW